MTEKDLLDFEDVMGNQLVILNLKYRHCVDRNEYPAEELADMELAAGRVFLAVHRFRGLATEGVT